MNLIKELLNLHNVNIKIGSFQKIRLLKVKTLIKENHVL